MKYLQLFEHIVNNRELRGLIKDFNVTPIFHAIKSENAIKALEENELKGYSIQRTWQGGRRLKDDDPDYESSDFLRGISLTRDPEYANKWHDIIFVFDKEKLRTKYKMIPYNWGYSIGRGYRQGSRAKREREEFLITGFSKNVNANDEDQTNRNFMKMVSEPQGSIQPLDKYLIGFYISNHLGEYMKKELRDYFENNKKYLGIYRS